MGPTPRNPIDYLVVNTRKEATGCVVWTGKKDKDGYGLYAARINGQRFQRAHRGAFQLFVGEIPDGLFVLHTCDNPSCVTPCHLWLGTNADNLHDMAAKGRSMSGKKHRFSRYPETRPKGVKNVKAKLDEATVLWVHGRAQEVSVRTVAQELGLCRQSVYNIIRGITWRHLPRAT